MLLDFLRSSIEDLRKNDFLTLSKLQLFGLSVITMNSQVENMTQDDIIDESSDDIRSVLQNVRDEITEICLEAIGGRLETYPGCDVCHDESKVGYKLPSCVFESKCIDCLKNDVIRLS